MSGGRTPDLDLGPSFDDGKGVSDRNNLLLAFWQDTPRTNLRQLAIRKADAAITNNWKNVKEDPSHGLDHINEYLNSIDAAIRLRKGQSNLDPQDIAKARAEAEKKFPEAGQAQDLETLDQLGIKLPAQLEKVLGIYRQIKEASTEPVKQDALTQAVVLELRREAGEDLIAEKEQAGTKLSPAEQKQLLGQLALSDQELKALEKALTGKEEPAVAKAEAEQKTGANKEAEKKENKSGKVETKTESKDQSKKDETKDKPASWQIPLLTVGGATLLSTGAYGLNRWLATRRREGQLAQYGERSAAELEQIIKEREFAETLLRRTAGMAHSNTLFHPDNFVDSPQSRLNFTARLSEIALSLKPENKEEDVATLKAIVDLVQEYGDKPNMSPVEFLYSKTDPLGPRKIALVDQAYKKIGNGMTSERHPVSRMITEMQKILDKDRKLPATERMELQFFVDTFQHSVDGALYFRSPSRSKYATRDNSIQAIEALTTETPIQMALAEAKSAYLRAVASAKAGAAEKDTGADAAEVNQHPTRGRVERSDQELARDMLKRWTLDKALKPITMSDSKNQFNSPDTREKYLRDLVDLQRTTAISGEEHAAQTAEFIGEYIEAFRQDTLGRSPYHFYVDTVYPWHMQEKELVRSACAGFDLSKEASPVTALQERMRELLITRQRLNFYGDDGTMAKQLESWVDLLPANVELAAEVISAGNPNIGIEDLTKEQQIKAIEALGNHAWIEFHLIKEANATHTTERPSLLSSSEKWAVMQQTQENLARSLLRNGLSRNASAPLNLIESQDQFEKQVKDQIAFLKLISTPEQNVSYDQFLDMFNFVLKTPNGLTVSWKSQGSPANFLSKQFDGTGKLRSESIAETRKGLAQDAATRDYFTAHTVEAYEKVRDYLEKQILPQEKYKYSRDSISARVITELNKIIDTHKSDGSRPHESPQEFLDRLNSETIWGLAEKLKSKEGLESTFRELCRQEAARREILESSDRKDYIAIADWLRDTYMKVREEPDADMLEWEPKPGEELAHQVLLDLEVSMRTKARSLSNEFELRPIDDPDSIENFLTGENYIPHSEAMDIFHESASGQMMHYRLAPGKTLADMALGRFDPATKTWETLTGRPVFKVFADILKERAQSIEKTHPERSRLMSEAATALEAGLPASGTDEAKALESIHSALVEARASGNMEPLKKEVAKAKGGSKLGLAYIAGGALTSALGLMITVDSLRSRTPSIRSRLNQPLGTETPY